MHDSSLTMVLGPGGIPVGMFRMPYGGISLPFESCGLGIIGVVGAWPDGPGVYNTSRVKHLEHGTAGSTYAVWSRRR